VGRRGPAPEPLEAKLARGETRPSRINLLTPKPRLRRPSMPRELDELARAVWRRTMREQAPGLIRAVDADLLRAYCEAVSRYAGAIKEYSSPTIEGVNGGPVANPLHRIIRDNADTIRMLARELGIGPSSRAGLQIEAFGEGGRGSSIDDEIGPPPRERFRVVGGSDDD
jgi:P27 family predicted phage terminase small subunit